MSWSPTVVDSVLTVPVRSIAYSVVRSATGVPSGDWVYGVYQRPRPLSSWW